MGLTTKVGNTYRPEFVPGSAPCATQQLDGAALKIIYYHVVPSIGMVLTVDL